MLLSRESRRVFVSLMPLFPISFTSGKTIWPNDLAVFYPHPGSLPFWQVLGAVLLLIAVTVTVILEAKRLPYLAVGWLWFAGTLVPVIGIVQVGSQALADRYTYIPLIGLFIMAAWGVPELLKNWRYRKEALAASSALILHMPFNRYMDTGRLLAK